MKSITTVFLLSFFYINSMAQIPCSSSSCILDSSIQVLQRLELKYNCDSGDYVSPKSFNEIINQVFSKVVVKNDDLVKNGTATNIKIDGKDKTISGNASFKANDYTFWNIGIAGKTEGKTLSVFQGGVYSKGFSLSTGFDTRLNSSIMYDDSTCEKLTNQRKKNNIEVLKRLHGYLLFDTLRIKERIDSLKAIISIDSINIRTNLALDISKINTEISKKEDSLQFYREIFVESFRDISHASLSKFLEDENVKIEKKNASINGYALGWLNCNISFSNQGYNIFDTSITNRFFNDRLKSEYFRQYSLNCTYNHVWNNRKGLFFAYGGVSIQNQFGLQDFKFKKDTLIGGSSAIVEKNSIQAIDVTEISGSYNKSYLGITPQIGGFAFFGTSKTVGVEGNISLNIRAFTPPLIEHRVSYSFRMGVLFSLSKTDGVVSDGTLGLFGRVDNYISDKQKFKDALIFGVRLGIPFNNIKI